MEKGFLRNLGQLASIVAAGVDAARDRRRRARRLRAVAHVRATRRRRPVRAAGGPADAGHRARGAAVHPVRGPAACSAPTRRPSWPISTFLVPVRDVDDARLLPGACPSSSTRRPSSTARRDVRFFASVMLPVTRGGLAATAIFCVINSWNELLYGLILTNREHRHAAGRGAQPDDTDRHVLGPDRGGRRGHDRADARVRAARPAAHRARHDRWCAGGHLGRPERIDPSTCRRHHAASAIGRDMVEAMWRRT